MSVADAAGFLSVSTRTIRRLIQKGELPVIRIGGSIRIARAAMQAYITMHTESEPWQTVIMNVTPSH